MQRDEFELSGGEVTHWSLDEIDADVALSEQLDNLREDLAQIQFPSTGLVDVGWYPECNPEGLFVVVLIQNGDWEHPSLRREVSTLPALKDAVAEATRKARQLERQKPPVVTDEMFAEMKAKRDAQSAANLAAAKEKQHADGKEPFDMAAFEELYDTTGDTRTPARFERLYYLIHFSVRSLEEFAKLMTERDEWRG